MKRIILSAVAVTAAALAFVLDSGAESPTPSPTLFTKHEVGTMKHEVGRPIWGGCYTETCVRRVHRKDHRRAVARRKAEARAQARIVASMSSTTASWFNDPPGTTAGPHQSNGFAALIYGSAWGLPVRFCYRGRCAVGHLEDHGPYVNGRTFDLGTNLRNALGFDGVDSVRFTVLRR